MIRTDKESTSEQTPIWDENKTTGKKVPHKVLRYFPLTPRLRRLYSSRHTAKEMTWHKTGRSEEGKMRHPVDGTAWKDFDAKYPDFAKEPRNIRLALAPLEPLDESSIADEDILTSPVLEDENFSTDEDEDLVFEDDEPTVDPDVVERDIVPHYCSKSCVLMLLEDMVEIVEVVVTLHVGIRLGYLHRVRLLYSNIAKTKNKRGVSKSKNLEIAWKANGSRPLPVEFDISYEGTYYPLGKNGTMMNSLIRTLVRTHIPPYYFTWDLVPDEDKARILPRVESFFDIGRNTRNWERINEGINRYCGRRYLNRKSKLHDHFKTQGGPDDVDRARRNPPPSLRPVDWNKLIDDVFLDSNWQDRSMQNSNNRKNQPFFSFHGTQSYVNARFKKMNPKTRQIQGAIDNWHDNHYKEIGGWPNKAAKLAYEKLVAEREKEVQSQQASSSSSSNGITVNEREIFQKVFGERRGHTVGIGRKLNRPSGLPSSSTTSALVSYETMQKTIQEVVRVTQEASDRHHEERSRKWSEDFISQLSQIIPSVNFATFQPFESTPAPPFDYNAFVGSTNEVSQQQSGDDDEEECMNEND
ncbi:hypothetical protein LXL04_015641 [Taraxacum kok-saghyz]